MHRIWEACEISLGSCQGGSWTWKSRVQLGGPGLRSKFGHSLGRSQSLRTEWDEQEPGSKDQANPGKFQHLEMRKRRARGWLRGAWPWGAKSAGRTWHLSQGKRVVRDGDLTDPELLLFRKGDGPWDWQPGGHWWLWQDSIQCTKESGSLLFFFLNLALHHKHYYMLLKMSFKHSFYWLSHSMILCVPCFMDRMFLFVCLFILRLY